jgi:hypothetical protein
MPASVPMTGVFQQRRHAMAEKNSVVGVYETLGEAEDAVRALGDVGFPLQLVSVVGQDLTDDRPVHGYVTPCDVAKSSALPG